MKSYSLVNGVIYLGKGELIPRGFVRFQGDSIIEVGGMNSFVRDGGSIVELDGKLVLPGLTDCHIHLVGYSLSLARLDLKEAPTLEVALELVGQRVRTIPRGKWLLGRGWDKERWHLDGFPTKHMLDRVAPDHPVFLMSHDGHVAWLNSLALGVAGISSSTKSPEGGEIEFDENGEPTGILKERAVEIAHKVAETESLDQTCQAISRACHRLRSMGLVGLHTIEDQQSARILDEAISRQCVNLNLFRMVEVTDPREVDLITEEMEFDCIKVIADGTLGSQTASMIEPYCGECRNRGIVVVAKEKLVAIIKSALDAGVGVAIHAIGDRANMEALDAFQDVLEREAKKLPLRIEHAQLVRREDFARFARLGIIASMQPIHAISDREIAARYWGKRTETAYAWRLFLDHGVILAFGSDAPIEDPDPLKGIHAAVTRGAGEGGEGGWHPEQCLTIPEAIDCYTLNTAKAANLTGITGAIKPGLRADLTILDSNILQSDPHQIVHSRVWGTVVGGKPIWNW